MKRKIIFVLTILNILAFILLAVTYILGFDIQWGFTTATLIWGLPVAIIVVFVLIAGIITLTKLSWKWGTAGLFVTVIALVYTGVLLNYFSFVLLPPQTLNGNPRIENKIIAQAIPDSLVLPVGFKDDRYTIVNPDTYIPSVDIASKASVISEFSGKYGYDFTNLLERLLEINKNSTRLDIDTSIQDGYYIDYDGIFARYITKGYGGWLRWQVFHPQVWGYTEVSLPAYDPDSGYVLLYTGTRYNAYTHHPGGGHISIYKYIDGRLTFIDNFIFWVG